MSKHVGLSTNTWYVRIKKAAEYVLSWKSKGVYNSRFKSLYTAFLHSIKVSGYGIGIKFGKDPLAVEKSNYLIRFYVYIVYDLNAWQRNLTNNFKFKNWLFGGSIVMLIIVICLLMQKEIFNLKPKIKILTFQLNFVLEIYLMDLVLLSLDKYL